MTSFFRNIVSSIEKQSPFKQTSCKSDEDKTKDKPITKKDREQRSTQKIAELDSVLLFVIKETVLPDFLLEPKAIAIPTEEKREELLCSDCKLVSVDGVFC